MDAPSKEPRRVWRPGAGWRWARRSTQALALSTVVFAPLLGGWHRIERNFLSSWNGRGWDLPPSVLDSLPQGQGVEVYEANQSMGGGAAFDFLGISAFDPVAGLLTLFALEWSWRSLLAWSIPIVLALALGRVFCGWLCPFGTLARAVDRLLSLLPLKHRGFAPPERRPLRWLLLIGAAIAGAFGAQSLVYMLLPHVLVHQTLYGVWLMGGGGAALGALCGLLLAGLIFGPTLYCAAVCPTGAALSVLGRSRRVKLALISPSDCGAKCDVCDRACWLGLKPSTGDPGPDCDLCARCVTPCPKANLKVGRTRHTGSAAALLILGSALLGLSPSQGTAAERGSQMHPRLLLEGNAERGDMTMAISVVDYHGVRLSRDLPPDREALEVSVFIARGAFPPPDDLGRLKGREAYQGPLKVELRDKGGALVQALSFKGPTSPVSTPLRSIYRQDVALELHPGATLVVLPVEGWFDTPMSWTLQPHAAGAPMNRLASPLGASALFFVGLLSLAAGLGYKRRETTPEDQIAQEG